MDTYNRRKQILCILKVRQFETMHNLASEFNVSIRTIQRDITALSYEPIFTKSGKYGGVGFLNKNK